MQPFWQWLRTAIAPDGLPDVLIAFFAGAFAWMITNFLRSVFS
jgi:hypothetical protein